ncbi:MAG: hypothetical protein K2V38_11140, partial [Gemmataceae bacterium]|nr:hypothetical protein [Gemmataceae bacterium]
MSRPEPFASPAFVEAGVWNHGTAIFPVMSGGALVFTDGHVKFGYRLDFDTGGEAKNLAEGRYNIACFHRLADASGAVWEARTTFRPELFVHRIQDLNNIDWPMWAHHDEERVKAVADRPLITGVQALEDDRFYRRFWIDDTLLEIQFKYQGLTIDVGQMANSQVAVRVSGFFGSWCHAPMEKDCYL